MRIQISKFWKGICHIITLPIFAILYGIAWLIGFVTTMIRIMMEDNR